MTNTHNLSLVLNHLSNAYLSSTNEVLDTFGVRFGYAPGRQGSTQSNTQIGRWQDRGFVSFNLGTQLTSRELLIDDSFPFQNQKFGG